MNDIEKTFQAIDEYIDISIYMLFGSALRFAWVRTIADILMSHIGRIAIGCLFVFVGLFVRGKYEEKARFDNELMQIVVPVDGWYYFFFLVAASGFFILLVYICVLFYNLAKYLFR